MASVATTVSVVADIPATGIVRISTATGSIVTGSIAEGSARTSTREASIRAASTKTATARTSIMMTAVMTVVTVIPASRASIATVTGSVATTADIAATARITASAAATATRTSIVATTARADTTVHVVTVRIVGKVAIHAIVMTIIAGRSTIIAAAKMNGVHGATMTAMIATTAGTSVMMMTPSRVVRSVASSTVKSASSGVSASVGSICPSRGATRTARCPTRPRIRIRTVARANRRCPRA